MRHPLSERLTPAIRFLLEQVCVHSATAELHEAPPPAAGLAAEARRQRIAGLTHGWAQAQAPSALRTGLLAELAQDAQAGAIRGLNLVRETLQVIETLRRHGIDAMVLKGAMLSRRYYGDFGTRDAGDVDLLVDEARAVEADRRLQEAGYARTKPQKPLAGRRLKLYFDTQHEFGYRAPSGVPVELHWRFADCRLISPEPFKALWERSESVSAGESRVRVPGPADTFVQLAIHGYADGWSRLKWIADLPRVLAASAAVVPATAGIQRVVDLALVLAGQPVRNGGEAWLPPVFDHVAGRLLTAHPRERSPLDRLRHALSETRYHDSMLENAATWRAAAYCNLIMPGDFDRSPLPDRLTPLMPYVAKFQRGVQGLFGKLAPGTGSSHAP